MRPDWVMRSFPEEEQKKQPPLQEEQHISPAFALVMLAIIILPPFACKLLSTILLVFETFIHSFSDALKEFFRAAPSEAAFLTGVCIGLTLYYSFRRNKNTGAESKTQQPSAGTSEDEIPAPQVHQTFGA